MNITDINKILSRLAENPTRENVLDFSFALLQWMDIEPNPADGGRNKPQLLSPQTQKLKDFLATAPQTVQPQLYRISADNQNIRVRFAVLKKLKKEYISQLVDNDPGLSSYQTFVKGLTPQSNPAKSGTGSTVFIPAQPYFIHFVTTPDYDKLVLIFNQGEQKRIVSFRNRLTNTQYNKIILAWQGIGTKSKPDSPRPRKYWSALKTKLTAEGSELSPNLGQLKMQAEDCKMRETDVADTETLLRIIQSIPSPKAEPFKQWLAKVGYERMKEISNPEQSLERARENWQKLGRSEKWIQQRMTGQETRNKLTDYWKESGVQKSDEFVFLTNIIHQEWTGLTH